MDLSKLKTDSGVLYLSDLSVDFSLLEGDVALADRAWVKIRRANLRDDVKRAEFCAQRTMRYSSLSAPEMTVFEQVSVNPVERAKFETYLTLADCGNLTQGDTPVFPEMPAINIPFAVFEIAWNQLDICVAEAIHKAVIATNPEWNA